MWRRMVAASISARPRPYNVVGLAKTFSEIKFRERGRDPLPSLFSASRPGRNSFSLNRDFQVVTARNKWPRKFPGAIHVLDWIEVQFPDGAFFAGAFLAGPFLAAPFSSGKSSELILAFSHVSMKGFCV